jgi:hypothetical protein
MSGAPRAPERRPVKVKGVGGPVSRQEQEKPDKDMTIGKGLPSDRRKVEGASVRG